MISEQKQLIRLIGNLLGFIRVAELGFFQKYSKYPAFLFKNSSPKNCLDRTKIKDEQASRMFVCK